MPKRGDIQPITGLVYWDTFQGRERWRAPEVIAVWRARSRLYVSNWQKADPVRHSETQKRFRERHGVRRNAETRSYRLAWKSLKRKTDPIFQMRECLSARLSSAIRRIKRGEKPPTIEALGCSMGKFIEHIEALFWPGMTWKNHAFYGWHLDHIIPLASAKSVEDVTRLCHYTNLQPLWWIDNFAKGSKMIQV